MKNVLIVSENNNTSSSGDNDTEGNAQNMGNDHSAEKSKDVPNKIV